MGWLCNHTNMCREANLCGRGRGSSLKKTYQPVGSDRSLSLHRFQPVQQFIGTIVICCYHLDLLFAHHQLCTERRILYLNGHGLPHRIIRGVHAIFAILQVNFEVNLKRKLYFCVDFKRSLDLSLFFFFFLNGGRHSG